GCAHAIKPRYVKVPHPAIERAFEQPDGCAAITRSRQACTTETKRRHFKSEPACLHCSHEVIRSSQLPGRTPRTTAASLILPCRVRKRPNSSSATPRARGRTISRRFLELRTQVHGLNQMSPPSPHQCCAMFPPRCSSHGTPPAEV